MVTNGIAKGNFKDKEDYIQPIWHTETQAWPKFDTIIQIIENLIKLQQ